MADLPPNSNATWESFGAEASIILVPVSDEPVKDTMETEGEATRAAPVSRSPVTTLNTPSGMPTSCASLAKNMQDRPAISEGLRMAQFPATKAGATFRNATFIG